jgi:hypothetical protein
MFLIELYATIFGSEGGFKSLLHLLPPAHRGAFTPTFLVMFRTQPKYDYYWPWLKAKTSFGLQAAVLLMNRLWFATALGSTLLARDFCVSTDTMLVSAITTTVTVENRLTPG